MKLCPACGSNFVRNDWVCTSCGHKPTIHLGFHSFAPELADANRHFDPDYFRELAELEENNFWFHARNRLIFNAFSRYFPTVRTALEVGCGTGFVLAALERTFPHISFTGSEIFAEGLKFAAQRLNRTELVQMDAYSIPYREEFDVVCCFDVLEHIEDDQKVIGQISSALKEGGGVILTVPQHSFLWSQYDKLACHVRRYTRNDLIKKLNTAGFRVARVTSFVGFLLPLMLLSRALRNLQTDNFDVLAELRVGRLTNKVLGWVMDIERIIVGTGISLPWGGSLMIVAYKE